ncbi:MAG: hypothetical protein GX629_04655 [Phycisphaerae bacterium]|nr:hypothetical protein [Phycisphaerae bacterium]
MTEHRHCLGVLPEGDIDFSIRWACIRKAFTQRWLAVGDKKGSRSES